MICNGDIPCMYSRVFGLRIVHSCCFSPSNTDVFAPLRLRGMDGLPRDRRHYGQRNSYHDWVLTIGNATKRWRGGLLACKPVKTHPYLRFPRSIGTCLSGVQRRQTGLLFLATSFTKPLIDQPSLPLTLFGLKQLGKCCYSIFRTRKHKECPD